MGAEIAALRVWASPSRKRIAKSASVWTRTPNRLLVVTRSTKATVSVTTITTYLGVNTTAEIAALRVWVSPSRKRIAKSASVWTRTPNHLLRLLYLRVPTTSTKVMVIVTTISTYLSVNMTVEIAALRVWV